MPPSGGILLEALLPVIQYLRVWFGNFFIMFTLSPFCSMEGNSRLWMIEEREKCRLGYTYEEALCNIR
jgi:hypothetical protein